MFNQIYTAARDPRVLNGLGGILIYAAGLIRVRGLEVLLDDSGNF